MAAKPKPKPKAPKKPKQAAGIASQLGKPFAPWTPTAAPPPGSYDPQLDSQLAAGARGLEDSTVDAERGSERASSDYTTGRGDLERQRGEGLSDLLRSRSRGTEDYQSSLEGLRRNYSRLGRRQAEQQRSAGVEGGAFAAARAKRAENQAIEQKPVDEGFKRFGEDSADSELRLNQGTDRALGQLGQGYQRGEEDRGYALARANREQEFFGADVGASKWFQAGQTGYTPPAKPVGADAEYGQGASAYRLVRLPDGRLVNQMASGAVVDRKTKKRVDVRDRKGNLRRGFA